MKTFPPRVRFWAHFDQLLLVSGSCFLFLMLAGVRLQGQACNDLSVVALDADCAVPVTPDMVLEGTYTDSLFVVRLTALNGVPAGNILTAAQLGDTLRATVTDTLSGNSCWGLLVAEDHWAPALSCTHLNLTCALPEFTPAYLSTLGLTAAYPAVTENCGPYDLTYTDTWVQLGCNDANDRSAYIERVWTATDASGNTGVCTQYLNIKRVHIGQLVFPTDTVISCTTPLTAPKFVGQPYITQFGVAFPLHPDRPLCGLQVTYTDQVLPLCSGAYRILRTWVVYEDCLPASPVPPLLNPFLHIQIVAVADNTGPVFACPKDTVVFTDPFACARNFDLPDVLLSDQCARVQSIRANWEVNGLPFSLTGSLADFPGNNLWNPDTLGVLGLAENLPSGIIVFRYTATDDCGNTSTCSFRVTVADGVPPQAACDEYTQVALGITGVALVNASTFDDGSFDNCSEVRFKVRRVEPGDCQSNEFFFDQVRFCCADVGKTIAVILRVYDLPVPNGPVSLTEQEAHASDCLIQVLVEDKIKPACVPPLNQVVSCLNFDPSLKAHGAPAFADNCCLDTAYELPPNYSLFDTLCNRGTIVRNFRAVDCHGLSSQCSQRLIVNYEQNYAVKFPDDILTNDCDTLDVYGPAPEIFSHGCEQIAISYVDEASTGGVQSCYWISRRWTIINWCTYNSNLPLIEIPNPNPAQDPLHIQNFTGPVVAPPGHNPASSLVRVAPTDPLPTDFGKFWAADVNGYTYRQFIYVRDNVPPKIRGCPALTGPVQFCDHTNNDPLFWNAPYWKDPFIAGSTDLCEGSVDLALTANDGCSKGNVNIRYLLFLDLDGDGQPETVINSINPPPPDTVYFGNAKLPNFKGGQARSFDQRPVPPEEKYMFTMQMTGFVNRSAYVRWATPKEPTKYIIPVLPHGTHRILWIVEDGCGNETYCDYPIQVRDCRQPDLVCINGLSTDIPADKSITLWNTDFLLYADDNCTPAAQIRTGIRKIGTGIGFPFLPDGTPQINVTFGCDELGPQLVELWSIDAAGNTNMCITYVLVQDNFGVCGNALVTVAGLLRTEDSAGVQDVPVKLNGSSPALPPINVFNLSNTVGAYHFSNALPFGADYTVTPAKDNDPLNGVSTFDLVMINKHILGLDPLDSPYKMIAADANNSRSITTFDIIELRKLILGINTTFPDNESWRFVDQSYVFPNPGNPFQEIFPESRTIANLQASTFNQHFVAVKTGDVNGSAVANSLAPADDRGAGELLFEVERAPAAGIADDLQVRAGEVFTLRFRAAAPVAGYQFTLSHPGLQLIALTPGPGMSADHFGVFPADEALTTSFVADPSGADLLPEFSLRFRAAAGGLLSRMLAVSGRITRAEAYASAEATTYTYLSAVASAEADHVHHVHEKMGVGLRFAGSIVTGQAFELYQNAPNPWSDHTRIGFYLPEPGMVRLTVFDQSGSTLFTQHRWYPAGHHNCTLDRSLPAAPGVLYYRVDTETDSAVRKMVRG